MPQLGLACWLAWKLFAGQKKGYHRVSNFSSLFALAIGIAILITVTSVMDGFDREYHQRLFNKSAHFTINKSNQRIHEYDGLIQHAQQIDHITAVKPVLISSALIKASNKFIPLVVVGQSSDKLESNQMQANNNLLTKLDIPEQGNPVTIIFPRMQQSILGVKPIIKRFNLVYPDLSDETTETTAQIPLPTLQKILQAHDAIDYITIKISHPSQTTAVASELQQLFGPSFTITSWQDQYHDFFNALATERTMMTLVLSLIIFIAAFNLISGLVAMVDNKQKGIAILLTLGAQPTAIGLIFLIIALIIAAGGVILGTSLGLLLTYHVNEVVSLLETIFKIKLFAPNIYFVTNLPVWVSLPSIMMINGTAIVLCTLASIYPMLKANRIQPAHTMKYE